MADPIGILTSTLDVAHKVYDIVQIIKDAPDTIKTLEKETARVRGLLARILLHSGDRSHTVLQNSDVEDPQITVLLNEAKELTTMVSSFLTKATKQNEDGTHKAKRLRWPFYAAEAEKLAERFRAFHMSLVAVCAASTFVNMETLLLGQQTLLSSQQQQNVTLHTICASVEATFGRAAHEQWQGRSNRFDELCPRNTRMGTARVGSSHSHSAVMSEHERIDDYQIHGGVQVYAPAMTSVPAVSTSTIISHREDDCPDDCLCSCHTAPVEDIQLIPSSLEQWFGQLNISRSLAASLHSLLHPCSNPLCARILPDMQTVRYYPPVWFAHVEASIRFEAFPVHFCIQSPRVVPSLDYMYYISFDEYRIKLSTREITLHDVERDGASVLHRLLQREQQIGDAYELITYSLNAGIPQDWRYQNMTAVEFVAYHVKRYPQLKDGARSLDLSIVKPLLHDSLERAFRALNKTLGQSDLHAFLLQSRRDVTQALDNLRCMLTLPSISAQINRPDLAGRLPINYAAFAFPEAIEVLLQAGASPKKGTLLLHQYVSDQWTAVSALVRAGYPTDEKDRGNFGQSPLHSVASDSQPSYRHALELVRHGSHLLDWDAQDDYGDTPFDTAELWAKHSPEGEQRQLIRELFRTKCIPHHAQYISSYNGERLMDAEEIAMLARISLIDFALAGDVGSIGLLISAGAMINERDEEGRTLLHLIAMGNRVPNAYQIALELERYGGYGIDHGATFEGRTALDIANESLQRYNVGEDGRTEMEAVVAYLECPCLPEGEEYAFPCMDPDYCDECCSVRCTCPENDVPGMPGSFTK